MPMFRFVGACSAVLLGVTLVAACAPTLNWRSWRSDEIGVTQLFPCKPVRQQRKVQLIGRELQMVLQVCDEADLTWAQVYADAVDPAAVGPLIEALVAAAHLNLGARRGALVPSQVIGATPNPGSGRYRLRGRAPDGHAVEEVMLVFVKGTVVVQVTALGAAVPTDLADNFIGAVRVDS